MYATSYVWAKVLIHMENLLTDTLVSTWFDDAEVVELTETKLVLATSNEYRRDTIRKHCIGYVQDAMKELFDQTVAVEVYTKEELEALPPESVPFNPQFTFRNFIVGQSNRFAHAAAIAVANKPADIYNPLFIYGPSGLGKTHLLYAIANTISQSHPNYNIVYIKGADFTIELVRALQEGKNQEFRNKYRKADLLLVDDVQFIAGKEATQEEFFHTFNELYEHHKQIVLTSDRTPSELLRLEDRLKTRFEWGLIADINPPDYETRMAIIRNKAGKLGMEMPDDVCAYIAENITTNIRQIEGTVKKIKAYSDLTDMPVDLPNVTRAIKDMFKGVGKADTLPTPELIIGEVCRFYNLDERTLRGTLRTKGTAEARQIAMYLIRKLTNLSFPDIGKEFDRNHSTVMHAVDKIELLLSDKSHPLNATITDIIAAINNKL